MEKSTEDTKSAPRDAGEKSVAQRIIGEFLVSLGQLEGYQEISAALSEELATTGKLSESNVKFALFGDDTT